MKKKFSLVVVAALACTALACAALVACGGDSNTTQQPNRITEPAATARPTSIPAAAPTLMATATPIPIQVSTPIATAIPTPTAAPRPTATAIPTPIPATHSPSNCPPGGVLDDVETISSCAEQAMQQVKSFSFEGEFNLLNLFSGMGPGMGPGAGPKPGGPGAEPEGLMRLSGAIVRPDRLRFEISYAPDGEMIQITAVVIGTDIYMQDPESEMWFKETPPESDFLSAVQMVGMLQLPRESGATLKEPVDLDDGTRGYVLSYDQTGQQGGMEGFGVPGGNLVITVGVDDFLTKEVRVTLENANDEASSYLLTIKYHGYNEPTEIEPPAQYVTLPDDSREPEAVGPTTVVRLAKNEDGDVEVTFNKPIHVQGQVELYVLDPTTGGWGLPLLGGSGTAILTFDADAEDRPPLVPGKSQIDGFIFPASGSMMTDARGDRLDLTLNTWTYR